LICTLITVVSTQKGSLPSIIDYYTLLALMNSHAYNGLDFAFQTQSFEANVNSMLSIGLLLQRQLPFLSWGF